MCVFAGPKAGDILVQQNEVFWRKHKSCGEVKGSAELKLNPRLCHYGPERCDSVTGDQKIAALRCLCYCSGSTSFSLVTTWNYVYLWPSGCTCHWMEESFSFSIWFIRKRFKVVILTISVLVDLATPAVSMVTPSAVNSKLCSCYGIRLRRITFCIISPWIPHAREGNLNPAW